MQPYFSIIIPTYNRQRTLSTCLQSLTNLCYPLERFEVIVVDDGSETTPKTVVATFANHMNVTLLEQSNAGPAAARNTGAARAKGEFLAFTDDDCTPAPSWLSALAKRFVETPDHMLGGLTLNALPENPYSAASQQLLHFIYEYQIRRPEFGCLFVSNNMAMPAKVFHQLTGFDSNFPMAAAEDRELCSRWQQHGYPMTFVPEAIIKHYHPMTSISYWQLHFKYGRGEYMYHLIKSGGWPKVNFDFYFRLGLHPFLQNPGWHSPKLFFLLIYSQIATALGYYQEHVVQSKYKGKTNALVGWLIKKMQKKPQISVGKE